MRAPLKRWFCGSASVPSSARAQARSPLGCNAERIHELGVLQLFLAEGGACTEGQRAPREAITRTFAQEHDRGESRTAREIREPIDAACTGPGMIEHHGIEALSQDLGRERAARQRVVLDDRRRSQRQST